MIMECKRKLSQDVIVIYTQLNLNVQGKNLDLNTMMLKLLKTRFKQMGLFFIHFQFLKILVAIMVMEFIIMFMEIILEIL